MKNHSDVVNKWIQKAENDYTVARNEIQFPNPITDVICFHCQQAVEKYLKAFLIHHGVDFGRTHDVDKLKMLCEKIDPVFKNIDLKDLNFFAVQIRYPDDFYLPSIAETQEYLEITGRVRELVLNLVRK